MSRTNDPNSAAKETEIFEKLPKWCRIVLDIEKDIVEKNRQNQSKE